MQISSSVSRSNIRRLIHNFKSMNKRLTTIFVLLLLLLSFRSSIPTYSSISKSFLPSKNVLSSGFSGDLFASPLDIQLDETYREKYINHLLREKGFILETELTLSAEDHKNIRLMEYLDEILFEELKEHSFAITESPYHILSSRHIKKKHFSDLPLGEQANFYLHNVIKSSNFTFSPIDDTAYLSVYKTEEYLNTALRKYIKIKSQLPENVLKIIDLSDENFQIALTQSRQRKLNFNDKIIHQINNNLINLRFFNNFFINNQNSQQKLNLFESYPQETDKTNNLCSQYESILFPWLSGESPIFIKYDKLGNVDTTFQPPYQITPNDCILHSIHSSLSKKGIVITTPDINVPETMALIMLLRALDNELPIQILYKDDTDLNEVNRKKIAQIGQLSLKEIQLPKSYLNDKSLLNSKFPVQDITFIDMGPAISLDYSKRFKYFSIKLLSFLFNSFKEMIFLDADTIPFLKPTEYFHQQSYLDTGLLFFRDRETNGFFTMELMKQIPRFFTTDNDSHYLNLLQPTNENLSNRYLAEGGIYFMESGLVLMNRKDHFQGILASCQISLFRFISSFSYGDKELIWLGQQMAGNTNYRFSKYPSVAIGELSILDPEVSTIKHSNELCSTHPAHIDDNGKDLLWMNSGFTTCKKFYTYSTDVLHDRYKDKFTVEELKSYYLSPLKITHALIPPAEEYKLFNPDMSNEPDRGWKMSDECAHYLWCAYDVLGGGKYDDKVPRGKVIEVPQDQTLRLQMLGELWITYYIIGKDELELYSVDLGFIDNSAYVKEKEVLKQNLNANTNPQGELQGTKKVLLSLKDIEQP